MHGDHLQKAGISNANAIWECYGRNVIKSKYVTIFWTFDYLLIYKFIKWNRIVLFLNQKSLNFVEY